MIEYSVAHNLFKNAQQYRCAYLTAHLTIAWDVNACRGGFLHRPEQAASDE